MRVEVADEVQGAGVQLYPCPHPVEELLVPVQPLKVDRVTPEGMSIKYCSELSTCPFVQQS